MPAHWPIQQSLARSPWLILQLDVTRCIWAVLPAAVLWGASFPAAVAAIASRGMDLGRVVGGIYAANTVGAIIGSVAFSMLVIPRLGTHQAQRLLIGLSVLAALIVFVPLVRRAGDAAAPARGRLRRGVRFACLLGASALAGVLGWNVPAVPWQLIAYGRTVANTLWMAAPVYVGEGMNSSVAVTDAGGERYFHVSGKIEASSEWQDMRLQRMLGHIPALIQGKPRSVLVVGCGAGVTAGSFVVHPGVERIVICEIEPLIPQVVAKHFAYENHGVLTDPRVRVVYDDARHYVLTTQDHFDIITSDPIHPWVKGAATLYTREYFEMCKRRLNPGGVVTQWVPLYESNAEAVKSELRTFFEAFPHGTIWSNDKDGRGYDLVLLGQVEPTRILVDFLEDRLGREDYREVADSLLDVGFNSASELLATYAGQGRDLEPWLRDAEVNRDRNLRLQYLAGMGLNSDRSEQIFEDIAKYCRFSDEVFLATDAARQTLKQEMAKSALRRARP
ncbi:MAG: spermidine synthase [Tepidisphaerales bacterium]